MIVQKPTDLVLVVRDLVCFEGLNVLQSITFPIADLEVSFNILGESHSVTISQDKGPVLQEVLACTQPKGNQWLHCHSFHDGKMHGYRSGNYCGYVKFFTMSTNLVKIGGLHQLEMEFPHPYGGRHPPFTRIWWEINEERIAWKTLHVYPSDPEQAIAVFSNSRFLRKEF